MRRFICAALAVLSLIAGTVTVTAAPAHAGIGYWSNGCNPHAEWKQNSWEVDWGLWTRNEYNKANTVYFIQYDLRRIYRKWGNECGRLAELTSAEAHGTYWDPFWSEWREGWVQRMVFGSIYSDRWDCNHSRVTVGSTVYGGQC